MRLIDADELIISILTEDLCGIDNVDKAILNAPEVEAIPVKWIKEQLQKAVDFTHSKAEGMFIDNGCVVEVVSASFTANVLLNLLEEWGKENETN